MEKKTVRNPQSLNLKRLALMLVGAYAALAAAFYFLAGEQLRLRQSRGNLAAPAPESGTVELVQGALVEQAFCAKIQRLERVSVQLGTYYRANSGTVRVELLRPSDAAVLMEGAFDAAEIADGQFLSISAAEPIEPAYGTPFLLRLYADSPAGSAVTPLASMQQAPEGFSLTANGEPVPGTLCFSASGTDYIWTGLHYWEFAAAGLALLLAFFAAVWNRVRQGKHSYVANAALAVGKYRFLIRQLVARDFKTKYKRSILGVFWSFLNPLLAMSVQYIVFSTIFQNDIPNYPAYLLIGVVSFNFFNEACGMALASIIGNAGLITKVYVPKYIYPLTRVMSSAVNLAISLLPLLLVCFFTGVQFHPSAVLSLFFMACLTIFSLGLGLLLSSAMVFFRDTQFLWGVFSMMWMYATPVFYPESILPEYFKTVLRINPLYHFLKDARMCILDGISPEPVAYMQCFLMAAAMLIAGALVFRKTQDRFVLYL